MRHILKTWPVPFQAVWAGLKPYEIRVNDRNFQVGDALELHEWDHIAKVRTGRVICAPVAYMTNGGEWGLPPNLCVLGIPHIIRFADSPRPQPEVAP